MALGRGQLKEAFFAGLNQKEEELEWAHNFLPLTCLAIVWLDADGCQLN